MAAIVEHALAGAEDDREEEQAVLVDEIVLGQPADQGTGTEDDEVAVGAVLQGRDGGG